MEKRKLGFTDLYLSTIGLGTWAMGGGDWQWGWGPQDEKESISTIQRSLDLGINWFDTAAAYGLGRSEQVVGRGIAGRQDDVIVATKCGLLWEDDGTGDVTRHLSAKTVRRETEDSLRRLNVDAIDLYQIHWPTTDDQITEAWATIADLIQEGKIRYAGVSNFSIRQLKLIQPIHPVASLQPPYNMLNREPEDTIFDYCLANDIGLVTYSPLHSGLLTDSFSRQRLDNLGPDDWRSEDGEFLEPRASINLAFVEKLKAIAVNHGRSVSQLAIAWNLRRSEVTSAIVGARRPSQIEKSAPAADWRLTDEVLAEIESNLSEREKQLAEAGK